MPDPPINPGLLDGTPAYPWLRLVDASGSVLTASDGEPLEIAAVIIAPGPPLPGQARTGAAPGPAHYLDSVTVNGVTYDNADSDGCRDAVAGARAYTDCPGNAGEEFILYPDSRDTGVETDSFNDRIAYLTAEELLRAAEARALGAMAVVLERYRSSHGAYPWMAPYTADPGADPTGTVLYHANVDGTGRTRRGLLPVHAMPGQLYDTHYTLSWTIDSGAEIVTSDSSSSGSIPAPSDAELYALASTAPQRTIVPVTCAWNGDDGVRCTGEPYRYARTPATCGKARSSGSAMSSSRTLRTPGRIPPARDSAGANPNASSPRTRTVITTTNLPASFTVLVRGRNYEVACIDADCSATTRTGGMSVERTLTVDTGTLGTFTFTGLEYDLSVAQDGIPRWFVDNEWHRYVYAAVSGEETGAGRLISGKVHRVGGGLPDSQRGGDGTDRRARVPHRSGSGAPGSDP